MFHEGTGCYFVHDPAHSGSYGRKGRKDYFQKPERCLREHGPRDSLYREGELGSRHALLLEVMGRSSGYNVEGSHLHGASLFWYGRFLAINVGMIPRVC